MAKNTSTTHLFDEEPKAEKSQDFASLFEQSLSSAQRNVKVGDQLKGEILTIGKDESFV